MTNNTQNYQGQEKQGCPEKQPRGAKGDMMTKCNVYSGWDSGTEKGLGKN